MVSYAVEPGYNDIGLYEKSSVASDILWYQLIPHCSRHVMLLGYNNTSLLRLKISGSLYNVIAEFDCMCMVGM